ncbi:Protein APA1 [Ceratocystis fimbriata CBS 114723]|uniref:Protein APA1 n=1 Tax=Ceratocystis fimbriata CBS 114723 TaxID=1035309 RepID=A0A2C5WWL9_9PEZI|nr:Protein APA1 [Ceratocystis fimbriata CBS 114723]
MSSLLKAPPNLPDLVTTAFSNARATKDLYFFPTQVTILATAYGPFQIRYAPSLAQKPKNPVRAPGSVPFDPFATPPPALRIVDISPAHFLVLNKFAIAPEHFILATTAWRSQEDVLEAEDIEAAYACVQAYRGRQGGNQSGPDGGVVDGEEHGLQRTGLFVFYNGGPHSGASQPHRHLQLVPMSSLYDCLSASTPWSPLIDSVQQPTASQDIPIHLFTKPVSDNPTKNELFDTYLGLYAQACKAVLGAETEVPSTGKALISYNFSLTGKTMALCPRISEGARIGVEHGAGKIQLNGTILAGTALVKNEAEWVALRKDPSIFEDVLRKVGVPRALITESKS